MSEDSVKRSNSTIVILIILLVVSLGVAGYQYFRINKLTEENYLKGEELTTAYARIDDMDAELNERIQIIDSLGGDISELEAAKAELEKEKKNLQSRARVAARSINNLRDKVDGYEELLKLKDEEIERLTAVNEELLAENTNLKEEKNELNASISEISKARDELTEKVETASQLKVENFKVTAVNGRGKERVGDFKSKHVDKLKVEFNIAENSIAPVEGKEILLRLLDPQSNVIFDLAKGSGTFVVEGKEEIYTSKQDILFDNTEQKLSFVYDKESEYSPGRYQIEVYTDEYLMGSYPFTIR